MAENGGRHPLAAWLAANPDVTQTAVAARLKISKQYLGELLRKDLAPSYPIAADLAEATYGAIPVTAWHTYWLRQGKRGYPTGRPVTPKVKVRRRRPVFKPEAPAS